VTSLDASFTIDFSNGDITNGYVKMEVGGIAENHLWTAYYNGQYFHGVFDNINLESSSTVTHDLGLGAWGLGLGIKLETQTNITGELSGALFGPNGETFVGAFDLVNANNPLQYVQGLYTLETATLTPPVVVD
jgi:hypothetical protein